MFGMIARAALALRTPICASLVSMAKSRRMSASRFSASALYASLSALALSSAACSSSALPALEVNSSICLSRCSSSALRAFTCSWYSSVSRLYFA